MARCTVGVTRGLCGALGGQIRMLLNFENSRPPFSVELLAEYLDDILTLLLCGKINAEKAGRPG
jgi:hypothetical protein